MKSDILFTFGNFCQKPIKIILQIKWKKRKKSLHSLTIECQNIINLKNEKRKGSRSKYC